jgi:hypothetical protein
MPRKPIGDGPMTDAERQARHRAAQAAGRPASCIRSSADRRSRIQRWRDAVAELATLRAHYAAWLDALPPSLQDGATAETTRPAPSIRDLEQPIRHLQKGRIWTRKKGQLWVRFDILRPDRRRGRMGRSDERRPDRCG